jgi:isopentenyl-diphosphate delta-isomerase
MNWERTSERKQHHLDLCQNENVGSIAGAGWDQVSLRHRAVPELNFKDIQTNTQFLGQTYPTPFLISSMTGGSREGDQINETLARFAEDHQIPMGVGSQRVALENRDLRAFALRKVAPRAKLFANLGAVQLNYGVSRDDLLYLVDQLEAQALILHWNPLQEAIQEEGDRNFSELLPKLRKLCADFPVPIIMKETGCGMDLQSAESLVEAGASALDVAGLGGTHWGFIEGLRSESRRELGEMFRNWGTPSALALKDLAAKRPKWPASVGIIASGGVRHGLDAAKALALGADLVGMALPFLKAASQGRKALDSFFETQVEALRIAMFCTGSANLSKLRKAVSP